LSRLRARVSFQLSVLRILAGQTDGRASIEVVKHHLAIYYGSGPEWPARMSRIASRLPELDIFKQKLINREAGYWTITEKGLKVLAGLEQLDRIVGQVQPQPQAEPPVANERAPLPPGAPGTMARRNRPVETD
jgi:hypothetical protein